MSKNFFKRSESLVFAHFSREARFVIKDSAEADDHVPTYIAIIEKFLPVKFTLDGKGHGIFRVSCRAPKGPLQNP